MLLLHLFQKTTQKSSYAIHPLVYLACVFAAGFGGYYLGKKQRNNEIVNNKNISTDLLYAALQYGDWTQLSLEQARNTLTKHLDAAKIPHGDLAVSSEVVHSRRYVISQWQRAAIGVSVIVLSQDKDGDLVVALGEQRGKIVNPEGYMELPLPKTDLTGLRNQSFSRINGNTLEGVHQDVSLEAAAIRKLKEELGLDVKTSDLVLLFSSGGEEENSIVPTQTMVYATFVKEASNLGVVGQEFANDNITRPSWHKVNKIYLKDNQFYVHNGQLPIRRVAAINLAIRMLITNPEESCKQFLDISADQNYDSIVSALRTSSSRKTLK